MTVTEATLSAWIGSLSDRLTPARVRTHALILAVCLWGTVAVDYSVPGSLDRAGNIKFQDFLQFPISARLIQQGNADQLYDDAVLARGVRTLVGRDTNVYLQYFYGPQDALPFMPLVSLPFLVQAGIWVTISLALYFACIYFIWKRCAALRPYGLLVAMCALAYPPLYHVFVRGQLSALVLACFAIAYFALASRHEWLAGAVFGCLAFKPQFLVAIPLILLLARAWKILAGVSVSAGAQLILTWIYFGHRVMQAYLTRLLHSAAHPGSTELTFSAIQMHSLHTFLEILIPWRPVVWSFYLLTSAAVIAIAATIWRSPGALALRFSALSFAAVLVNPHLYIYDLLALAPALLLLTDWLLGNANHPAKPALAVLLYLAFLLPLFGPLAYWTHLQFSVVVFAAILWVLFRITTASHKLAFAERVVV